MYKEICEKYAPEKHNLLYILHDIQDHHPQHYISEEAVQVVAEYLNIPTNHIYGVLTFYTMYSTKPRGKNIIRLCESPPSPDAAGSGCTPATPSAPAPCPSDAGSDPRPSARAQPVSAGTAE